MTLVEFLQARIAEDDAHARASYSTLLICHLDRCKIPGSDERATFLHHERWEPPRVLAECEAKRRIVEHHAIGVYGDESCSICTEVGTQAQEWPCLTLRLLAMPYADHADYLAEWAP